MASFVEQLSHFVESEEINLLLVTGIPRSISTALCRSLSSAPNIDSLYINEPFNRIIDSPEEASAVIMDTARTHFTRDIKSKRVMIIKNMASYLSLSAYLAFEDIASYRLWVIRDPLIQMGSLVTRIANDMQKPGSDELEPQEVYQYLESVSTLLENSEKSRRYSKTGWLAIAELFDSQDDDNFCVVDGEKFVDRPQETLQAICFVSGIPYGDIMVTNWSNSFNFVNVVNIGNETETRTNAWTQKAATATGIAQTRRTPLDIDRVPERMREHIIEVAIPIYNRLSEITV